MKVEERFLQYVGYPTMSDENSESCPSSARQWALIEHLVREMQEMGLEEVKADENGYVTAAVPANVEGRPTVGFIAHMDTSPDAPDAPVRPCTVLYEGEPVLLNAGRQLYLDAAEYPALNRYKGQHLIVTDGTTLLGADDKAGIAEILTAVEELLHSGRPHGRIRIGFTPDEEIGRGADRFDVESFGADYAYTVDGGALGELEYENFNAAGATIRFSGVSIHPGSAKNKMKNAALMAMECNALLPAMEIPRCTEGREGFFHLTDMSGDVEHAQLRYIIRDHDRARFEERKRTLEKAVEAINEKWGADSAELILRDSYYNMKEKLADKMWIVERAADAMRKVGVEPEFTPVRGGTDGARLSFMGLPCPNICTGGENFHSRFEYVPVESMEKITAILLELMCGAEKIVQNP